MDEEIDERYHYNGRRRFLEAQRGPSRSKERPKRLIENAMIKLILRNGVLDE